jgi:hypothetical protein
MFVRPDLGNNAQRPWLVADKKTSPINSDPYRGALIPVGLTLLPFA